MSSHLLIRAQGLTFRVATTFTWLPLLLLAQALLLQGCWRHNPAPEQAAILVAPEQGSFDDMLLHPGERRLAHILPLTLGQGHATHPVINLDGTQIAFEAIRDGASCEQVFVMDADGRNTRQLSSGTGRAINPAISPTGTQILYQSTHLTQNRCASGEPEALSALSIYPAAHDLFLAHLGSGAARTLVAAPNFQGLASFSPRGERVVYTQLEEGNTALFIAHLDGDEVDTERLDLPLYTPGEARFDPQGQRLVLTGAPDAKQPFVRELFVWNFDAKTLTQLTQDGVQHGEPIFHPDGKHILFSSNLDARPGAPGRQIYMIDEEGKHLEQITFAPGMSTSPSLSALGTRFVFSSTRGAPDALTPAIFITDFLMTTRLPPRLRGQAAIELDTLVSRVATLAAPEMQGREAGSAGEQIARDWLQAQFELVGLRPHPGLGQRFLQTFEFERPTHEAVTAEDGSHTMTTRTKRVTSANLIGWLPAREDGKPTELTLVIGAHYDHAGFGNAWLSQQEAHHGTLHPGADDNASGIAAMLEVAEALATSKTRRHDVVFVAFGAEEYGVHGSTHFVNSGLVDPARTLAMINMDMVGRLEDKPLILRGTQTSLVFRDLVRRHHPTARLDVDLTEELPKSTDYVPFHAAGIPVLGFHTGLHQDYHTPEDVESRIDYDGLGRITLLVYLVANELIATDRRPRFVSQDAHGAGVGPSPHTSQDRDYQSAPYFGSVPGRSPAGSPKGIYLRAVQEKSPAESAGLRAGDLITHFDGEPLESLPQFAEALMKHEAGDVVKVTYVRGEEKGEVEVTLGEPRQ